MGASDAAIRASPPALPVLLMWFELTNHQQDFGCPKRPLYLDETMF